MKIRFAVVVCAALLCAGCIRWSVPVNEIKGSLLGEPFELSNPKNMTLTGLKVQAERDSFGVTKASITISNLTSTMSPEVITTTGTAQALMLEKAGDLVVRGMEAAK